MRWPYAVVVKFKMCRPTRIAAFTEQHHAKSLANTYRKREDIEWVACEEIRCLQEEPLLLGTLFDAHGYYASVVNIPIGVSRSHGCEKGYLVTTGSMIIAKFLYVKDVHEFKDRYPTVADTYFEQDLLTNPPVKEQEMKKEISMNNSMDSGQLAADPKLAELAEMVTQTNKHDVECAAIEAQRLMHHKAAQLELARARLQRDVRLADFDTYQRKLDVQRDAQRTANSQMIDLVNRQCAMHERAIDANKAAAISQLRHVTLQLFLKCAALSGTTLGAIYLIF